MLRHLLIVTVSAVMLGGCSFAPVVAQKMGLGTANENDIRAATANVFGVPANTVKITNIAKDDGFNGTRIYYNASISSKSYRCGMLSSFAGSTLPKCVKPGEPLALQ